MITQKKKMGIHTNGFFNNPDWKGLWLWVLYKVSVMTLTQIKTCLSWVLGSCREGGRQLSPQSAGCHTPLGLEQTPSIHVWSPRLRLSSLTGLGVPAPVSPAQCTEIRGKQKSSVSLLYSEHECYKYSTGEMKKKRLHQWVTCITQSETLKN